jgi:phage terminase small subunit
LVRRWEPDRLSRLSHAEHEALQQARDEAVRQLATLLDRVGGDDETALTPRRQKIAAISMLYGTGALSGRDSPRAWYIKMIPKPPKFLSAEARKIWRQTVAEFAISDSAGLLLLRTALEAFDQLSRVRATLKREGLCVVDRFGQKRLHPLCGVEHNARTQLVSALRALKLDPMPLAGDRDD